jgi:hypothetical protein
MNRTLVKSSSLLNPCPPYTGLGYFNDSGLIYIVCDESLYDPLATVEQPMTATALSIAYGVGVFLVVVLFCSLLFRRQKSPKSFTELP